MFFLEFFHQYRRNLVFILSILAIGTGESVDASTIRLSWQDTSTSETGFKIQRLSGNGYAEIATVGANIQTYTDTGLTRGVTYCYRIFAFNSSGASAASNAACATALSGTVSTISLTTSLEGSLSSNASSTTGTRTVKNKWSDYRVSLKLSSRHNDALGVMFRYQDSNNYYRFSWHARDKTRRLEKCVGGTFTTLAQDSVDYKTGRNYGLQIIAQGPSIKVFIDGKTVFSATDSTFDDGTIGLYSSYTAGSSFDDVIVDDLATGTLLLSADFNSRNHLGWTIIDEGTGAGPSQWSASTRALVQGSNIGSSGGAANPGTYALYTRGSWQDYRVTLKMRSMDNNSIGVVFRFQDNDNYYRFAWDRKIPGRRLFKRENGVFNLLAEDAVPYVSGRNYGVEIVARGASLKVAIDGIEVFSVTDRTHMTGTIALYSSHNTGAYFDDVRVDELSTKRNLVLDHFDNGNLSGWMAFDEAGTSARPSVWSVLNGEVVQSIDIGSDTDGTLGTVLVH